MFFKLLSVNLLKRYDSKKQEEEKTMMAIAILKNTGQHPTARFTGSSEGCSCAGLVVAEAFLKGPG